MIKHKNWFWVAAITAACLFDFLFWQKPFGISFFIWTVVLLGLGYLLAWGEGKKPALASLIITVLVLGFSSVPAWRTEPMTRFISVTLTLGGLLLLSATFLNGHWPFYHLWNFVKNLFIAFGGGFYRVFTLGSKSATPPPLAAPEVTSDPVKRSGGSKFWAVIRGLLIGLPIVTLLALLLSSADPIFADWLKRILNIEKLPEYLFRLFYITMIACFLIGLYLHAIIPNRTEDLPDPQKPWIKPSLGWTETAVVLSAVDLLFLTFVFIQMRYLFGGTANINETGYTFSEYARRGYAELVAVAIISLGLYLLFNTVTKKESKGVKTGFSILSVLLMVNVLVILASSMQRLLLYEDVYGFSELRTYTHVNIYWLAGLILVTILLELFRRQGHFGLALLVTIIGFGATLAIMNVDGFITIRNLERAVAGEKLDMRYQVSLTTDAIPQMIKKYRDPQVPNELKDTLGYSLACRQVLMEDPAEIPWQGFDLSTSRAFQLLQDNKASWSGYEIKKNGKGEWYFMKDEEIHYCSRYQYWD